MTGRKNCNKHWSNLFFFLRESVSTWAMAHFSPKWTASYASKLKTARAHPNSSRRLVDCYRNVGLGSTALWKKRAFCFDLAAAYEICFFFLKTVAADTKCHFPSHPFPLFSAHFCFVFRFPQACYNISELPPFDCLWKRFYSSLGC